MKKFFKSKTIGVFAAGLLASILGQLEIIDWTEFISPAYAGIVSSIIGIVLRLVTKDAIEK